MRKSMNSIPCTIVLIPSAKLEQRAIVTSAELQKLNALFQLTATGPFPHITLYMTQLKIDDLKKVKEILAHIATTTPLLDLTATGYDQTERYIDATYDRTNAISQLQMTVVNAINPIREGLREKDKVRMLTATGKVRENLEQYGYRGVGELFRPHMTFTRFADSKVIGTSMLPAPSEFSGQFVSLGLFEMGDNGTCMRKIAAFKLGTSH